MAVVVVLAAACASSGEDEGSEVEGVALVPASSSPTPGADDAGVRSEVEGMLGRYEAAVNAVLADLPAAGDPANLAVAEYRGGVRAGQRRGRGRDRGLAG